MNIRFIKYILIFFAFIITLGANAAISDFNPSFICNNSDIVASESKADEIFNIHHHNDIVVQNLHSHTNYIYVKNKKNNENSENSNFNQVVELFSNNSKLGLQKIKNLSSDTIEKKIQEKIFLTEISPHAP